MALIIATGSNLGDSQAYLQQAQRELSQHFNFIAASRVYRSPAVDYTDQPDFLNQVLQFDLPKNLGPTEALEQMMAIEKKLGRQRDILRGPRTVDLDILFWGLDKIDEVNLQVPHPRLWTRSFVVRPLSELPYFSVLDGHYTFADAFEPEAFPIA